MAKAAKTAIKTKDARAAAEAKNWTKVIKAVRSPKTGAYTFKEAIIHKDNIKSFLAQEIERNANLFKLSCSFPERLFFFKKFLINRPWDFLIKLFGKKEKQNFGRGVAKDKREFSYPCRQSNRRKNRGR